MYDGKNNTGINYNGHCGSSMCYQYWGADNTRSRAISFTYDPIEKFSAN